MQVEGEAAGTARITGLTPVPIQLSLEEVAQDAVDSIVTQIQTTVRSPPIASCKYGRPWSKLTEPSTCAKDRSLCFAVQHVTIVVDDESYISLIRKSGKPSDA